MKSIVCCLWLVRPSFLSMLSYTWQNSSNWPYLAYRWHSVLGRAWPFCWPQTMWRKPVLFGLSQRKGLNIPSCYFRVVPIMRVCGTKTQTSPGPNCHIRGHMGLPQMGGILPRKGQGPVGYAKICIFAGPDYIMLKFSVSNWSITL